MNDLRKLAGEVGILSRLLETLRSLRPAVEPAAVSGAGEAAQAAAKGGVRGMLRGEVEHQGKLLGALGDALQHPKNIPNLFIEGWKSMANKAVPRVSGEQGWFGRHFSTSPQARNLRTAHTLDPSTSLREAWSNGSGIRGLQNELSRRGWLGSGENLWGATKYLPVGQKSMMVGFSAPPLISGIQGAFGSTPPSGEEGRAEGLLRGIAPAAAWVAGGPYGMMGWWTAEKLMGKPLGWAGQGVDTILGTGPRPSAMEPEYIPLDLGNGQVVYMAARDMMNGGRTKVSSALAPKVPGTTTLVPPSPRLPRSASVSVVGDIKNPQPPTAQPKA